MSFPMLAVRYKVSMLYKMTMRSLSAIIGGTHRVAISIDTYVVTAWLRRISGAKASSKPRWEALKLSKRESVGG